MKMHIPFKFFHLLGLLGILSLTACVDQDFDEPPLKVEIAEPPQNLITIAELKARHTLGQVELIQDSVAIDAVVVADDESGNYFKTLIIQDETAGIELKINTTDLYNDYPIGQQIFVQLKGLFLGDFRGVTQIGGTTYEDDGEIFVGGIEEVLLGDHISRGQPDQPINPTVVTIDELDDSYISQIVQLENVQFTNADAGVEFADSENKRSINLNLEDCNGNSIILRTSGFADFANQATPEGNGTLTAIFSVFRDTKQLFVRDEKDLAFDGERCDGSNGNGGGNNGVAVLVVDFQDQDEFDDINLSGWQNITLLGEGTRRWIARSFQGNFFAQASAFQDDNPQMDTWLITPPLDMSEVSTLEFESATAFYTHNGLSVLVSSNYDGSDVEAADWSALDVKLAGANSEQYEWIASGTVDLSQYQGTIYVAFRHQGASSGQTGTFRLDNIIIK